MPNPLQTFIIYSRYDAKFKDELLTHLDVFVRKNLIRRWVDSDLLPGEEWEKRIEAELEAAHLVLILVSADALNSDFIQKKELKTALEKKQRGAAKVVPVLVRDCMWELEEELASLQMLPMDDRGRIFAVEAWSSRSSAWAVTCRELLKLIQEILTKIEEESIATVRQQQKERAAADEREVREKIEKLRHQKDEKAWDKLRKEVESAPFFEDKIDFVKFYLEEETYVNHRESAENWLHELIAEHEAQKELEALKKKLEAERLAREAIGQKRWQDETKWQVAIMSNTIAAFKQYIDDSENQLYRDEAVQRIEDLKSISKFIRRKGVVVKQDTQNSPTMVFVKGGGFNMGSNENENERPVHRVNLSSFWIGEFPVTFEEYDVFCVETGAAKPNDNGGGRGRRPVVHVCWEDAYRYTSWLSEKTGNIYRLPTEAEWEYAARGGVLSKGYKYSGADEIDTVAWYDQNSGGETKIVGKKKPNELGIYDMSGNVWEWCGDWYGLYSPVEIMNPIGPIKGVYKVFRGGSAYNRANLSQVNYRSGFAPSYCNHDFGFRVVCVHLY